MSLMRSVAETRQSARRSASQSSHRPARRNGGRTRHHHGKLRRQTKLLRMTYLVRQPTSYQVLRSRLYRVPARDRHQNVTVLPRNQTLRRRIPGS